MARVAYYIALKKNKGRYIPINWGEIPAYKHSNLNSTNLKNIDEFTKSMFQNEKELKDFMVKNSDFIDLDQAINRDKLADITTDYLLNCLMKIGSTAELRILIINISNQIGISNWLKKSLRDVLNNSNISNKEAEILRLFKSFIIGSINNDGSISQNIKHSLINQINNTELISTQVIDLVTYVRNSKPMYEIEKTFPIVIVRREPKLKSEKYSEKEVFGGIAYIKDAPFLDISTIKMILIEAVYKPDHALLQELITRYGHYDYQFPNILAIREYLRLVKKGSPFELKYPLEAINDLIEKEITVHNKTTGHQVRNDENQALINYPGLRRLGMFISQRKSLANTNNIQTTFEERVQQISEKNAIVNDYAKQLNFLKDL